MRTCTDCGDCIDTRGTSATRCLECAGIAAKRRRLLHAKKLNSRLRSRELRLGLPKGAIKKAFEIQAGACAVCGIKFDDLLDRHMHADHNHKTGQFRGLLCVRCNMAIGYAKDSSKILRALARYLDKALDAPI